MNTYLPFLAVATEYPNVERLGVRNFKYPRVLNEAYGIFAERIDWMGWTMPGKLMFLMLLKKF
jgi:hypothetical protein